MRATITRYWVAFQYPSDHERAWIFTLNSANPTHAIVSMWYWTDLGWKESSNSGSDYTLPVARQFWRNIHRNHAVGPDTPNILASGMGAFPFGEPKVIQLSGRRWHNERAQRDCRRARAQTS